MKTLLQINVLANTGSTGKIADQIGSLAQSLGWRSVIAYGRGNPVSKSELYPVGGKLNMFWHIATSRLCDSHGLSSKISTRKLVRFIEELKPDVIHLHNIHGYYLNYQILFDYLKKSRIPVVWTLHDCWSFTGHCSYFDAVSCTKWIKRCYNCPQLHTYPKSFGRDKSSDNFDRKRRAFGALNKLTMVPVSDWLSGLLADSYLKDKAKMTIHNGIDTTRFQPLGNCAKVKEKYGIGEQKVVLGVANVWEPRKGFPDFLKLRENLSDDYEIVLVGLSSGQIAELPKGIVGLERTESVDELAALYTLADVFFNPTYEDNFPTVNMEAMSCGTPVVTYDTGGCKEALSEETGAAVPKGDLEKAIIEITAICEKGKEHYAKKCRSHVLENFEKNANFMKYIELYNSLI